MGPSFHKFKKNMKYLLFIVLLPLFSCENNLIHGSSTVRSISIDKSGNDFVTIFTGADKVYLLVPHGMYAVGDTIYFSSKNCK